MPQPSPDPDRPPRQPRPLRRRRRLAADAIRSSAACSLPFTTPFLLGGRIRRAERGGAELVLANPAGAEGVYILPWSAMPSLCAPTLHDRALWERAASAALPELCPAMARRAARAVAESGFAGRDAARAATAAEAARRETVTAIHYGLLLELLRRIEPTDSAADGSPRVPTRTPLPGLNGACGPPSAVCARRAALSHRRHGRPRRDRRRAGGLRPLC